MGGSTTSTRCHRPRGRDIKVGSMDFAKAIDASVRGSMSMRLSFMCLLVLLACGGSGPQPNQTYFWKLTTSTIEFNSMCSDEATFRQKNQPIEIKPDSYFIYKVSADGKTATHMTCETFDVRTCIPHSSGLVFTIAGLEMSSARDMKQTITSSQCSINTSESWLLTDKKGSALSIEISDTFSLVGDRTDCDEIEAQAKSQAPNGKGFQGCAITMRIEGVQ